MSWSIDFITDLPLWIGIIERLLFYVLNAKKKSATMYAERLNNFKLKSMRIAYDWLFGKRFNKNHNNTHNADSFFYSHSTAHLAP